MKGYIYLIYASNLLFIQLRNNLYIHIPEVYDYVNTTNTL